MKYQIQILSENPYQIEYFDRIKYSGGEYRIITNPTRGKLYSDITTAEQDVLLIRQFYRNCIVEVEGTTSTDTSKSNSF